MTKLRVHEKTPEQKSKEIKLNQVNSVTDSLGRIIKLRKPDVLDEFDLNVALGEKSTNLAVAGMATMLLYVESIDGIPFEKPITYAQIRAGIKRLEREGIQAVVRGAKDQGLLAQLDEEGEKETLKKLSEMNP